MTTNLELLKEELPALRTLSSDAGAIGFFGQEALRFHSIAGTLVDSFSLDSSASVDERYITHILARSLLENYFWLLYIFDDTAQRQARYDELINSFKREYLKLWNENLLPQKNQLEPADPAWSALRSLNVNSMLAQVRNVHGDRLDYLYFIYRITSFDIHGKNLDNILQATFGKPCNFPVLKLDYGFDLIANQYVVILQELRAQDEI